MNWFQDMFVITAAWLITLMAALVLLDGLYVRFVNAKKE